MNTKLPITVLKGVGESKAKMLNKINIRTIDDLIHYYPRDYESKKELVDIGNVIIGEVNFVKGIVSQGPVNSRYGKMIITRMKINDATGAIFVTWFRQPYLKNKFSVGQEVLLKGKVVLKNNKLQLSSPNIINKNEALVTSKQQFFPIYPLTKNVSAKMMTNLITAGLKYTNGQLNEYLPMDIRDRFKLCEYNYALKQIHNPDDEESLIIAKKRLIFDEFLFFQLGLQLIKKQSIIVKNKYTFNNFQYENKIYNSLPFELTNAQKRVWQEIKKDLKSNKTMNRLVQGDVGSGKTIIAALSLITAVENGYQGTMIAPTEVLAKQHYSSLKELLEPLGINVGLLVGSMTNKEKTLAYESIENGNVNVVVGTHAVIQDKVRFNYLALVITDEQHRFGVKQRETLAGKGDYPHVLVMSATPIPRTLALIVYGDMDVSIIDELPIGRQKIKTHVVNSTYRDRIYEFLIKEITNGRQCYIVCPMVEDNEEMDLESVMTYTDKLINTLPQSINIRYLHGKMKAKEKNDIMTMFSDGEIDILVSTTVIEVGINVPNATIMVIENAERFGLAQLHQLRGRVGRGIYQSHCILISDSKTKISKERMQIMKKYTDGFIIAEYDLKLRGPGDTFGTKQHGLPEFRIGNIFENMDVLKITNELAIEILNDDMTLDSEKYKNFKDIMKDFFEQNVEYIAL